jgi:hypothetical protein
VKRDKGYHWAAVTAQPQAERWKWGPRVGHISGSKVATKSAARRWRRQSLKLRVGSIRADQDGRGWHNLNHVVGAVSAYALAQVFPPSRTQRYREMNHLYRKIDHALELPPHIEASDLSFLGRAASVGGFIPMLFEFKPVGWIKTKMLGEDEVELSWSSDGGQVLNRQSITLSRFRVKRQDRVCVNCPKCGVRRNRLFLVAGQNRDHEADRATYGFACATCSGTQEKQKRHTRQKAKNYGRAWSSCKKERPQSNQCIPT